MSSTQEKFNMAAEAIRKVDLDKLSNEAKLELYKYFKQGDQGKNTTKKPGMLDMKGKAKWNAWNDLGDMPKEEAQKKYIEVAK